MTTFVLTFSNDGIFSRACWKWGHGGCTARPTLFTLSKPLDWSYPAPSTPFLPPPPPPATLARESYLYSPMLPLSPSLSPGMRGVGENLVIDRLLWTERKPVGHVFPAFLIPSYMYFCFCFVSAVFSRKTRLTVKVERILILLSIRYNLRFFSLERLCWLTLLWASVGELSRPARYVFCKLHLLVQSSNIKKSYESKHFVANLCICLKSED